MSYVPDTAQPAVSIILPTYDRLAFLREAVASVLAQTFSNWELIVVDDGSTDDSVAWLKSLARAANHRRPRTAHRTQGAAAQRRPRARARRVDRLPRLRRPLAAAEARAPSCLARREPRHPLELHRARVHRRRRRTRFRSIDSRSWKPHSGRILGKSIEMEANIALPSVIAERALLREVGGFNEAWRSAEDYELWLRLAERCDCGLLDEPLLEVRKHRASHGPATGREPRLRDDVSKLRRSVARRGASVAGSNRRRVSRSRRRRHVRRSATVERRTTGARHRAPDPADVAVRIPRGGARTSVAWFDRQSIAPPYPGHDPLRVDRVAMAVDALQEIR